MGITRIGIMARVTINMIRDRNPSHQKAYS
jgi:hypothetical protein